MIIRKSFLMLFVSAFTFFGLSALQNISYFTDFFGDVTITVNIPMQEEENETSTSNEVKESKSKNNNTLSNLSLIYLNTLNSLAFQVHSLKHSSTVLEVATPPPKLFIG